MLISLMTTGLVGFTLFAYLNLVKTQHVAVTRSQLWNALMPVVEAGLEDALTHLSVNGTNTLRCDGWQQAGSLYYVERSIGAGSYLVIISNWTSSLANCRPVIESRGYLPVPWVAASTPNWFVAQVGAGSFSRNCLVRAVRVTTRPQGLFTKAIAAARGITLNGAVETDSFDSEDPAGSTHGLYDPAKARDRGDVATNGKIDRTLYGSGDIKIRGRVATGPGGTAVFVGNAAAGSRAWIAAGQTGIQPGWYRNDMNVSFPDVQVPFNGGYFTPQPGSHQGTHYTYLLGSGDYALEELTLNGSQKMLVTGQARLHVSGRVTVSENAYVAIAPGARLELYVGRASSMGANSLVNIAGQGVLNQTSNAHNFALYGLPSCLSITLSSTSAFSGVIYAPRAALTMTNLTPASVQVVGSTVTAAVNIRGRYQFHYDESLASLGLNRGFLKGFVVTSWNELEAEQAAALPAPVAACLQL